MPYLRNCCCGLNDLRSGTVIILAVYFFFLQVSPYVFAGMAFLVGKLLGAAVGILVLVEGIWFYVAVYAVYKTQANLFFQYVAVHGIRILLSALVILILIVNGFPEYQGKRLDKDYEQAIEVTLVVLIAIEGYFCLVMYSYYQQLTGQ